MRFTLRAKLLTIVITSTLAFGILIAAGFILSNRLEKQLDKIQAHYIPIIELGPRLEADFEHIHRSFQDSVASQDWEALEKTEVLKNNFLSDLNAAGNVVEPSQALELANSIEDYFTSAYDVSKRLLLQETGVSLVTAMVEMQAKQARTSALLKKSATLDRTKLMEAFATISKTQAASARILIGVSLSCLVLVTFLILGLSRSVLTSVTGLSKGLRRFGQGEFDQSILIARHDELGDVAEEANQMADRIRGLLKDLESFSYSVAHDLRAPLRSIQGFSAILMEDHGSTLSEDAKSSLDRVIKAAKKMGQLIDSLLNLSRMSRKEMTKRQVDLSTIAQEIVNDLRNADPQRQVSVTIQPGVMVKGDPELLQVVLTNLVGNAWKYSAKKPDASIQFGEKLSDGHRVYFVRDNGAGFDMQHAEKLFGTFQRLHTNDEFEGIGIGLATAHGIIHRHGGAIWAEAKPQEGATFYFTLWDRTKLGIA